MTHLIDKDKLIYELRQIVGDEEESIRTFERRKNQSELQRYNARIELLNHILSLLNTIEVKEEDLKKEIEEEIKKRATGLLVILRKESDWLTPIEEFAQHFFELGLKARREK